MGHASSDCSVSKKPRSAFYLSNQFHSRAFHCRREFSCLFSCLERQIMYLAKNISVITNCPRGYENNRSSFQPFDWETNFLVFL
jgi:hypothetical protein